MNIEDWETKYKEMLEKYNQVKKTTEILKRELVAKPERYIEREKEYRATII